MSTLEDFGMAVRNKIRDDYDSLCCISGREGIGKSSLGYHICKLVDDNFDVKKNIVYALPELYRKMMETPKYGSVLVDEGMECFYKRDHHNPARKRVIKSLSQARQKNLFYVFCSPRFTDLDEYLRNWRIRIWLRVTARGVAEIYFFDDNEMYGDPWHLKDKKLRKKLNYWGKLRFSKMSGSDKKEYLKIKRKTYERLGVEGPDSMGTVMVGRFAHTIHEKKQMSYAEMARLTGVKPSTIRWYVARYKAHDMTGAVDG